MSNYSFINTKMGSFNSERYSNGNCYPVTAVPHGMNFFTVQTDGKNNWFYSPYDKFFEGIRLTHMPSPWMPDYGKLIIWGERGDLCDKSLYWSSMDNHKNVIEPAYLSVSSHRDNYDMELTPTNCCAIMRFKFYGNENDICRAVFKCARFKYEFDEKTNTLIIENTDSVEIYKNKPETECRRLVEYIVIRPSIPCSPLVKGDKISLGFESSEFELRIATSFISLDQAKLNLEREVIDKSFDDVRNEAVNLWENNLSKIQIHDNDEEKKSIFYSCMYRAFLWPRRFYEIDIDGKAVHINTSTGEIAEGYLYTDNGFWDTYRTLYPFYSIIDTEFYAEAAEGFYNYYVDTGWLPKWVCPHNVNCMPGMLIEATMSDAIVKNIVKGDLSEKVFRAILKDGEYESGVKGEGRPLLSVYRKYGYYPYTLIKESVNETLDNAYGDYAIGMSAKKLGYNDIADKYFEYSKNYTLLFDNKEKFIRGKDENGSFRDEIFDAFSWGRDYTEGSAWQNAFGVYHDIKGLDELYGGKLREKIDELMSAPAEYRVGSYERTIHEMSEMVMANYGQCAISNQPSFHIPYIYSELGDPSSTSYHLNNILNLFNSGFEGYLGDEDNGSMSCWYILSALGLYQVAPSRPDFATAVPFFDNVTVTLSNGNKLDIVKSDYDLNKMSGNVSYFDVMNGGSLAKIVSNKK